jgi:hypothetical protein
MERGIHNPLSSEDFPSGGANHVGCRHILNGHLVFLSARSTDEIMTGSRIKQNDRRMFVQRKYTREDLLALENILHGSVVDATGLRNSHLLRTMWWMGDVALRGGLLRRGALSSEVARATTVEAGVAEGGLNSRWCRQVHHRWRWR